jgi:uncharacterized protein (DUF2062 family)
MPRRLFKRLNRRRQSLRESRFLKPFRALLEDPSYWSLNRKSVTRSFAIGLFICCSPLPLHPIIAACVALALRTNVPVAMATVFINNPVTMVPIYFTAYWLGCQLLGQSLQPFTFQMSQDWFVNHLLPVWKPFVLGCFVMGLVLSVVGYIVLGVLWHLSLVLKYRKRRSQE